MCRNSKNGAKNIVVLCFVFVLLASPCFARASWAGLFSTKGATQLSAEEPKDSQKPLLEESSPAESMKASETPKSDSYLELLEIANAYQKESTELRNELTEIRNFCDSLMTKLENYVLTEEISEAEYQELKQITETVTNQTVAYEEEIVEREQTIAHQDVEIAKLKAKAGFQPYAKINTFVGFDDLKPNWGAGMSVGAKLGCGAMLELGANYKIGDINNVIDMNGLLNLDRLTFTASVGWAF